jgi:disulfide bond formation protein DsbB
MTTFAERSLLLLGLAALAALAVALAMQYLGGLEPCPLCIEQRYPYLLLMAASALGLWLRRPGMFLTVAALILAVEMGLAGYHVGVEQGWFALPASCAASAPATTIDQLREQLQAAPARCDQVQFTLLGLSLSAWNGIYAAGLLVVALWALASRRRSAAEQDRQPRAA